MKFSSCGKLLIKKAGFNIIENKVKNESCPYCGKAIAGVGMNGESVRI